MINIRKYNPSDLESLADLMNDLGYPVSIEVMGRRMELIESNPSYLTFVATINEAVTGMIGIRQLLNYETDDLVTQISSLVTKSDFQGQGVGSALIKFIEDWAVQNGSSVLYLTSGIKQERLKAHEFYKKYGFEITGYRFIKKINI
ncbi:GNAT family N-acetyltransferase [Paenibacillus sediminis]|uniref:GNAT superfamily N-acetyltransferase n=1 Tax=Paenibacillus sediminis TaxID=664909 RepID=A0ABS4H827_9BACL|nr:GNAT family N-acetyltransferase [Paenibacillus sediminis]MBP1938686.1 GNAT superfamily N-acetyltransferase [Paenibacillus sediminis]